MSDRDLRGGMSHRKWTKVENLAKRFDTKREAQEFVQRKRTHAEREPHKDPDFWEGVQIIPAPEGS